MSYEARDNGDRYRDDDRTLDVYLEEIGKIDLITIEEERELGRRIHQGDEKALEKLVTSNLRFVVTVAKQYQNQGLSLTDLISEGNLGLIKAAKKYDESRGFKFISYAVWWIRQAIIYALAQKSNDVKIPINKFEERKLLEREIRYMEQEHQGNISPYEAGVELGIARDEIEAIRKTGLKPVRLDHRCWDDSDNDNNASNFIADEEAEDPSEAAIHEIDKDKIRIVLMELPQRYEDVIRLYFGIGCDGPHTLEQIGDRFGITRERVRQIKEKALRMLRHPSRMAALKHHY